MTLTLDAFLTRDTMGFRMATPPRHLPDPGSGTPALLVWWPAVQPRRRESGRPRGWWCFFSTDQPPNMASKCPMNWGFWTSLSSICWRLGHLPTLARQENMENHGKSLCYHGSINYFCHFKIIFYGVFLQKSSARNYERVARPWWLT